MFQYEYEKRPPSASSCSTHTTTTDISRNCQNASRVYPNAERARRPLPPTPTICHQVSLPTKTSVPLRVWVISGASCLAVCAALVLATVVIATWGNTASTPLYHETPDPTYAGLYPSVIRTKPSTPQPTTTRESTTFQDLDDDLQMPILEKLSIFKNIVVNRDKNKRLDKSPDLTLISKPQLHPLHDDTVHHEERKIQKKDKAKYSAHLDFNEPNDIDIIDPPIDLNDGKDLHYRSNENDRTDFHFTNNENSRISFNNDLKTKNNVPVGIKTVFINGKRQDRLPDFKPTLPDVFKVFDSYVARKHDAEYDDYYNDENLYDDYMQSNSMTSYLIEKVQELHDWITSDPDFQMNNSTSKSKNTKNEFTQLLKSLNESITEGNVTIIMNKLKDLYFGENYTMTNHTRSKKVISSNSTDLLSFGILTLDVILLHNIQVMAWENIEGLRNKMLRDPDVFAFNAFFLDPSQIQAKHDEVFGPHEKSAVSSNKRQNHYSTADYYDVGKSVLENILEVGMSTARAAIHLGRAYKNTKTILSQLSNPNREAINSQIQQQLSRGASGNQQALSALLGSYWASELDCSWLVYCRNLAATARLPAPYGPMAALNGMALRMLTGELPADKALDALLYEALTGWTELKCNDMFPRCSKVNAAAVVMDSILQPLRKSQSTSSRSP